MASPSVAGVILEREAAWVDRNLLAPDITDR
jgi:hypothetical protein